MLIIYVFIAKRSGCLPIYFIGLDKQIEISGDIFYQFSIIGSQATLQKPA
ncbi:hypothetical protein ACTXGL_08135 [Psychrobacter sp. T6-6]